MKRKKEYVIDFSRSMHGVEPKRFYGRAAIMREIMEGMANTDGAERDHYVDMLMQLNTGHTTLYY